MDSITKYILEKEKMNELAFVAVSAIVRGADLLYDIYKYMKSDEHKVKVKKCSKYKGKQKTKCKLQIELAMRKKYKSRIIKFRSDGCTQHDKGKAKRCIRYYNNREKEVNKEIISLERRLKQLRDITL